MVISSPVQTHRDVMQTCDSARESARATKGRHPFGRRRQGRLPTLEATLGTQALGTQPLGTQASGTPGQRRIGSILASLLAICALSLSGISFAQQTLEGADPLPQPVAKVDGMPEDGLPEASFDLDGEPEALVTPDLSATSETDLAAETPAADTAQTDMSQTDMSETEVSQTEAALEEPADPPINEAKLPEPVDYYVPKDGVPQPLVPGVSPKTSPQGERAAAVAQSGAHVANPMVSQPLRSIGMAARQPISVTVDRAKVLRLSAPAETVIIGNPAIVDVTLQDAQTLVLTAKGYGTTNLIILDASGRPMADEVVQTRRASASIARIYRGSAQYSYSCTPDCTQTPAVGDETEHFENAIGQAQSRVGWSNGALN